MKLRHVLTGPARLMRVRTSLAGPAVALAAGSVLEFSADPPSELASVLEEFDGDRPPNVGQFDVAAYERRRDRLAARLGFPPGRKKVTGSASRPRVEMVWAASEVDAWRRDLEQLVTK